MTEIYKRLPRITEKTKKIKSFRLDDEDEIKELLCKALDLNPNDVVIEIEDVFKWIQITETIETEIVLQEEQS